MQNIVVEPTQTAQWHALVSEAEAVAQLKLDEDCESYLVFLLMRFANKPEMADSLLGLEFLESMNRGGRSGLEDLRDVGDKCLLYSGLFPLRARRRLVNTSYFVDLGRSAYHHLQSKSNHGWAELYGQLVNAFVPMMDVLQSIRELDGSPPTLDALSALELWQTCQSHKALDTISRASNSDAPIPSPDTPDQTH